MFCFRNFVFKLRGLEYKISKLVIKEIQEKQDNLNKSHPCSRYNANSDKKNNVGCILTLILGSFSLVIDLRYNFVTHFLQ